MTGRLLSILVVACSAGCGVEGFMRGPLMSARDQAGRGEVRREAASRRDALGGLLLGAGILGLSVYAPAPANAGFFGLGGDDVTAALDELSNLRVKVEEVLSALKKKELKGGKEDSATVIRYSATYFQPLQAKMLDLAPKLKLADDEQQKRAETLPLLLKGHLLELQAATRSGDAAEQLEEMEEVAESVDEFLGLAKGKFAFTDYLARVKAQEGQEYDVVKDYGPFACEFWGKERLPGSNICVEKEGEK